MYAHSAVCPFYYVSYSFDVKCVYQIPHPALIM